VSSCTQRQESNSGNHCSNEKMPSALHPVQVLTQRLRITVRGVVQGVGFRPHVYACARRCGVTGFVGNEAGGVFLEVEGSAEVLQRFQQQLRADAPPLAFIEALTVTEIAPRGSATFCIVASDDTTAAHTLVAPDISLCEDCVCEVFDPQNRRYRYPFTNCTNCGPRFTIIRALPYDRSQTTMAGFAMCVDCEREYHDPRDRRFHAQPNACSQCGPQLEFVRDGVSLAHGEAALHAAQQALRRGEIVAVKGIGGFHLACDAANEMALQTLRERKGRVDKPFAVMARDMEVVARFAEVKEQERALLRGQECPIVLLRKKADSELPEMIAPGNQFIGVMLPYAPLHHLLFADDVPETLVMTSGNHSDEPIATDNAEAMERLSLLADAFLLHNRAIQLACDDSVVRVFAQQELPLRRSRGYAPFPVTLPFALQPTLAVGGELKSTFCLATGYHALMSQHIGDLENLETLHAFENSVAHFQRLFRTEPTIIAADKHPRYLSSQWAKNYAQKHSLSYVEVQHHHAHIAAVMAEHGLTGEQPVIGFAFDGTGYGDDGTIWGGEVLLADYAGFTRAAHLQYVPLPSGDAAIKRPFRAALAHLWAAGVEWHETLPPVAACSVTEQKILQRQLATNLNCIATSSMGRLFDAVAALAGVRQTVTYEAQAAIELEALAATNICEQYEFALSEEAPIQIAAAPLVRAVADDVLAGVPVAMIAAKFHHAVADVILQLALRLRARTQLHQVALSGGVFQNVTLLEMAVAKLLAAGFAVFTHRRVPPNDGGLALGQAVIANFIR
jgi:hydrogenase maturation protein HypF